MGDIKDKLNKKELEAVKKDGFPKYKSFLKEIPFFFTACFLKL